MLKKTAQQGRSPAADPRFAFHASRFTLLWNDARTPLADFFSILLGLKYNFRLGESHRAWTVTREARETRERRDPKWELWLS